MTSWVLVDPVAEARRSPAAEAGVSRSGPLRRVGFFSNSKQHAVTAVSASATATAEGQQYDASVLKANHPDTHHHDDSSTDSDTINAVRNKISSNIPTSVKDDINIKNGINKKPPQERERWWHRFAILKNELTELLTQQTHLTLLLFSCGLLIGVII